MTDLLGDQIRYYLPHDPDPTLEDNEYFYMQETTGGPRVIRVFTMDVLPTKDGGTEYGIYQRRGCHYLRVDAGYGNPFRGVRMSELYDNKQDCRDRTHWMCEYWPKLREKQKEGEHIE